MLFGVYRINSCNEWCKRRAEGMSSPGLPAVQEQRGQAEVGDAVDYLLASKQDSSELRIKLQPAYVPEEDTDVLYVFVEPENIRKIGLFKQYPLTWAAMSFLPSLQWGSAF